MLRPVTNYIFLMGREVTVYGSHYLTSHLPTGSRRAERIDQICRQDRGMGLRLVVYDPVMTSYNSLLPGTWYLIPDVLFTGRTLTRGTTNCSFSYDMLGYMPPRRLSADEVRFFRDKNCLPT